VQATSLPTDDDPGGKNNRVETDTHFFSQSVLALYDNSNSTKAVNLSYN